MCSLCGLLEQRALHPQERQPRVAGLVLGDLGHAVHHRHALDRVGLMRELHLVHADQRVPGALHAIQRLEHLADLHRHLPVGEQRLERAHRRLILGRGREDVAVLRDRVTHTLERVLQHLAESVLQC